MVHPDYRMSADQANMHPWIQWQINDEVNQFKLDDNVLLKLSEYSNMQRFK